MYDYDKLKSEFLFTDEGQRTFIQIRDRVLTLLRQAGAVRMQEALKVCGSGDSWEQLACFDRMVEIGDLVQVHSGNATQFRVYVASYGGSL